MSKSPRTDSDLPADGSIGRKSAAGVGSASLVSAAVGYVLLLVAARTLDTEANAVFLAFWSFLFFIFGVLGGITVETTRASRSAAALPAEKRGARFAVPALLVGLGAGALLLISSFWWGEALFGDLAFALVPVVSLVAIVYAGHATTIGALGGTGRWGKYSATVFAESGVRLGAAAVVFVAGATVVGLAIASALAAAAWLILFILSKEVRAAYLSRADVPAGGYIRNVLHACVAAMASAALVVGFPAMLKFTTADNVYLASAPLLMALSLTRAPLMIPLTAFQGVAITHFMSRKDEGAKAYIPIFLAVLGVAAVGAAAAAAIGPWLMVFLLGPDYHVSGGVLAALTFDSGFLALLTLTGALTVAAGRHRAYSLGWICAVIVSLGFLLLPVGIELKTILSLGIGPLCGIVVHTVFVQRSLKSLPA